MPISVNTPRGPVQVTPGNFKDRIEEAARLAGISGKFHVQLGGQRITASDAPAMLDSSMSVTIFPYDRAGS